MSDIEREQPCRECGYQHDSARSDIADALRYFALRYVEVLRAPAERLRAHTAEGTWSPLEYACHMRDVLRVQKTRIHQTLVEDMPKYASMRRDERAIEERYNDQNPSDVSKELAAASNDLAESFDELRIDEWRRRGIYGYPHEQVVDIEWIGRRTVHELIHHLMDMERQLI